MVATRKRPNSSSGDEEKTAFHTRHGVYCFTKMPFGLKNAGATYQRLMDKAFESQVGWNIEVYVDDLVVKSYTEVEMMRDIEETFRILRKVNIKLNPKKCWDKAMSGQNSSSTAITLTTDNQGAKQAFQQLKHHLSELPLLAAPKPQEELIMYFSATYGAVSAVLMTERRTTQMPIYFISRALQGLELNYSPMEKLVLSLVFAAKRLQGRLQKWSIMLGENNITYRPRTSVKGQILADFLIEIPGDVSQAAPAAVTQEEPWTLFTDGSSCFTASNNEVEYEALVAGLRIATQMGVKNVQVNVDSKLVANQVLGTYVAKEDNMIKYLEIVKGMVSGFTTFSISQVSRSKNKRADALSKIASTSFAHLSKQVLVEVLENKSIKEKEVAAVIKEDGPTWMTQLADYLKGGVLPGDKKEARKLRLKARNRHSRPLSGRVGESQIPDSRHGFLHKVDRSKGSGNNYRRTCEEIQIGMPTYRTTAVDVVNNDEELRLNLDLLEERRERAAVCEARAKSKMMKYYNARVRGVAFKPDDFIYRSNDASHAIAGGKLGPKWEGPYEVTEALGNGAYKLRSTDGMILLRTWNVTNLKRCYL
nr:reverse transcriptase domain-containing protein [Tanacetum cinerariifolium]